MIRFGIAFLIIDLDNSYKDSFYLSRFVDGKIFARDSMLELYTVVLAKSFLVAYNISWNLINLSIYYFFSDFSLLIITTSGSSLISYSLVASFSFFSFSISSCNFYDEYSKFFIILKFSINSYLITQHKFSSKT